MSEHLTNPFERALCFYLENADEPVRPRRVVVPAPIVLPDEIELLRRRVDGCEVQKQRALRQVLCVVARGICCHCYADADPHYSLTKLPAVVPVALMRMQR